MNILQQNQIKESQETICKIHNLEHIAVDIDLLDKPQIQFFCGKCLIEKINNNKITTIEKSKERILSIKVQYSHINSKLDYLSQEQLNFLPSKIQNLLFKFPQQQIQTKENQTRLTYYKNILDQIMNFKQSINDSLEKMYKQIQKYIFPVQKYKLEFQDQEQLPYIFEDIEQLSELYSSEQQKFPKLIEDNNFINEIQRQFELLFNNSDYFQTLDMFKNTKVKIKDFMENNVIDLFPFITTQNNDSKTPSLSRICNTHKREIIMIDMDSQNKKIEDRFVCVDCISENPQMKYQTIKNLDQQWKQYNSNSVRVLEEYTDERKQKISEILNQLAHMRMNYNQKLNDISDKLITEQFLFIDNTKQQNQMKKNSIQTLGDEQLLTELKELIEKKTEKISQSQIITTLKNKDSILQIEIESQLEALQLYDQQDMEKQLDILKDISVEKKLILQLTDMISEIKNCTQKEENQNNQIKFIKEIQELIDQAKKYLSQLNLFDQMIVVYQQHVQKVQYIQQNILFKSLDQAVESNQQKYQYSKLSNILNEYVNQFDNNSKQLKKFCNIQQMEIELTKLTEANKSLEIKKNNQINSLQNSFGLKLNEINGKLEQKEIELQNLKELYDQEIQDKIYLKKQYEQDMLTMIKKFEDQQNKLKQDFNQNVSQRDSELLEALRKLEQINKDKLEQDKSIKIELEKIHQYNKSLLFSNTQRHGCCSVSDGGKVVTEVSNGGWYYCLCEQAIPNTGKIRFAFQMLQGSNFMIGIGNNESVLKNSFLNCHSFGFGYLINLNRTYLIQYTGHIYSHHNIGVNGQQLSFGYKIYDIIIVEVSIEHKYIKWYRLNNPLLTFTLEIDTSQVFYPFVGVGWKSQIKILDNVPI